ncbi:MAG: hypothetical protein WA802_15890, partial [Terracidiphilus sp.]
GASILRRDGLAGVHGDGSLSLRWLTSVPTPMPLQLNVPTHCIGGYTQVSDGWFRGAGREILCGHRTD